MHQLFRRRQGWSFTLMVLMALGMWSTPAMARQGELAGGLDMALQPDFLRRDLSVIRTDLRLDDSQIPVVETLFLDYEAAFREAVDAVRQQLATLRPMMGVPDPDEQRIREQIRQKVAALLEQQNQLRANPPADFDAAENDRAFREQLETLRKQLVAMQPEPMSEDLLKELSEKTFAELNRWLVRKQTLRDHLVTDIHTLLNEDQLRLWPGLERKLLRQRALPLGRLSGEGVDLFHIAKDVGVDPSGSPAIADMFMDYELRFDEAIRRRNDHLTSSAQPLLVAMNSQNVEAAEAIIDQQIRNHTAVRDVNDGYAEAIAAALAEVTSAKFMDHYRQRAYPRVFRSTQVLRILDAATEIQGMSSSSLATIQQIRAAYQTELNAANLRLLRLVRQHESAEFKARLLNTILDDEQRLGAEASAAIQEAFSERDRMGLGYVRQIQGVLTPEQFERLPGASALMASPG